MRRLCRRMDASADAGTVSRRQTGGYSRPMRRAALLPVVLAWRSPRLLQIRRQPACRGGSSVVGSGRSGDPLRGDAAERQAWLEAFARGYFPGRSGQLFLVPREGEFLVERDPLYVFMHGSPWSYDTHIPLLLYGPPFIERIVSTSASRSRTSRRRSRRCSARRRRRPPSAARCAGAGARRRRGRG